MGMIAREGITDKIMVEKVSLAHAGTKVLDAVSLSIGKGSVVTMVGPDGCGKTILLKSINSPMQPDLGKVIVDGNSVKSQSPQSLARILGYVPQGHRVSFPFKVRDVVMTGRMPYIPAFSSPKRVDLEKTEQALALTGIGSLADQPYSKISGGERQLVMIARAMVQQPSVLLLDEPTSYLDFKNQIRTLKMIKEISRSRLVTVVMTLHDPNHALMYSDDVLLLRKLNGGGKGNVIAYGPPYRVITPENIREAYGIEVEIMDVRGRKILMPI